MEQKRSQVIAPKDMGVMDRISTEDESILPPAFNHREVSGNLEKGRRVNLGVLRNTLNYIHFAEKSILIHLRHRKIKDDVILSSPIGYCTGKDLICRLSDVHTLKEYLEEFEILHIIIDDGRSMVIAPVESNLTNESQVIIRLPETSYVVGQRRARRYRSEGVFVQLSQRGFCAKGGLVDFSSQGFRIKVESDSACSFRWFNPGEPFNIHLLRDEQVLFSEICTSIRNSGVYESREIVAVPIGVGINRFTNRHVRSVRQQLLPSPSAVFVHPFVKKKMQLGIFDICSTGFSAHEESSEGLLILGMIIPDLTISFGSTLEIRCSAQVIRSVEEEERGILYGFAFLDMEIEAYSSLCQILTNALDPEAYISSSVDTEALWEFFFDSGFIYPKKYRLIHSHKEDLKRTYHKLYEEKPDIARHFTCQKNGRIYGHISMVRAYERAWMIHHHAGKAIDRRRSGFTVLSHMMRYLHDMSRFPSAKMDYVISYFTPNKKIPDRIYGDFARALGNPRGCSMDSFCYLPYTSFSLGAKLPKSWVLKEFSMNDQWELSRFYNRSSGGLLLNALGIDSEGSGGESLEEVYRRHGFFRKWDTYSLSYQDKLKAVMIVNQSDMGLNFSELLNSVKVLMVDPEDLPWHILSTAVAQLTSGYDMGRVPILFYPVEYAKMSDIPFEKLYQLWVLDVRYGYRFMEYTQKQFRMHFKENMPEHVRTALVRA